MNQKQQQQPTMTTTTMKKKWQIDGQWSRRIKCAGYSFRPQTRSFTSSFVIPLQWFNSVWPECRYPSRAMFMHLYLSYFSHVSSHMALVFRFNACFYTVCASSSFRLVQFFTSCEIGKYLSTKIIWLVSCRIKVHFIPFIYVLLTFIKPDSVCDWWSEFTHTETLTFRTMK